MRLRSAANLEWQLALLVLIVFAALGLRPGQISGFSMEPRIDTDDYVLINALSYWFGPPRRGDIVAFRHERSAPSVYVKRVIGLPGDRIKIVDGHVYRVNDLLDRALGIRLVQVDVDHLTLVDSTGVTYIKSF